MRAEFEIYGGRAAEARLNQIGDRSVDLRKPFGSIRQILIEGHKQQFASNGSFLGTPWEPNAESTMARKQRETTITRSMPMRRTGALEESLSGGPGGTSRVSKTGVTVGTRHYYALFHIKPKRAGMPARPVLGINDQQRDVAFSIIEKYVLEGRLL